MKKNKIFALLIILVFILQSCKVNNTISFHSDKSQSLHQEMKFKEMIDMMHTFGTNEPETNEMFENLKKIPKTWTNFYDAGQLLFGKDVNKVKSDTIELMKKIFVKSDYENSDFQGLSMKYDRFDEKNIIFFNALMSDVESKIPNTSAAFQNWNGKSVQIKTDELVPTALMEIMSGSEEVSKDQMKVLLGLFKINLNTELKFEKKIKTIQGEHDWVKKQDDNTLLIQIDIAEAMDNSKVNKKDKLIIVTTE